jgi:hypothetical protein
LNLQITEAECSGTQIGLKGFRYGGKDAYRSPQTVKIIPFSFYNGNIDTETSQEF